MQTGKQPILDYFKTGEFEKAIDIARKFTVTLADSDIDFLMDHFHNRLAQAILTDNAVLSRQSQRRIKSLTAFRNSGFHTESLVSLVEFPDGYTGKILLVCVFGGIIDRKICLRSNDLYHRDILRNTELEIQDLGLTRTRVQELGGAFLHKESDELLWIRGASREFGACDREFAAQLVKTAYPEKRVLFEE